MSKTPWIEWEDQATGEARVLSVVTHGFAFLFGVAALFGILALGPHPAPAVADAPPPVAVATQTPLTADQQAKIAALRVAAHEAAQEYTDQQAKIAALQTAAHEAAEAFTGGSY